jgi:predicted DNA-binding protein (UPF0251 family)
MATKRQELHPNKSTGNFERLLGWKYDPKTKTTRQHKFYLGTDPTAAALANQRLERLWAIIESEAGDSDALWDTLTLDIGKALAKGKSEFSVAPLPKYMTPHDYVGYLQELARRFPIIAFVPADPDYFALGVKTLATVHGNAITDAKATISRASGHLKKLDLPVPATEDTLHQAFDAFAEHIRRTALTPAVEGETQVTSPYGNTQIRTANRLKERHQDMPLSALTLNAIQAMVDYWRARPLVKGTNTPITVRTAQNHIKQIREFFRWLHKNSDYAWRKPEDFDDLVVSVKSNLREKAAKVSPVAVDTYQLDELCVLYKYATPLERLFFLLGLNCGFGQAEIATVLVKEVELFKRHSHETLLGFVSTKEDSFIRKIRPKTEVYGEWLLWAETVDALQWAVRRRQVQEAVTRGGNKGKDIRMNPDSLLVLSEDGTPLVKQTAKGNRASRIANLWNADLTRRIRKSKTGFRSLSFNKIRKTAGNMIRDLSDGEVAGVFLCHGEPVRTDTLIDIYTNRPFAKVFKAIRLARERLQPVFEFHAEWPEGRKKGGLNISLAKVEQIQRLHAAGVRVEEIAKQVGVHRMTVYRHIKRCPPCTEDQAENPAAVS